MPRRPRHFIPGLPNHIVHRGNNRQPIFFDPSDYQTYLHMLGEGSRRYGCAIHAYVLMTNHVHLLVTPEEAQAVSRMMQFVGRQFVPRFNAKYERTGTLWEGRFRANLVADAFYLMACYRYIEMNPVRAGMVNDPALYQWSSYRSNALGQASQLLKPRPEYLALGQSESARCAAYRAQFSNMADGEIESIRNSVQKGVPLLRGKRDDQISAAGRLLCLDEVDTNDAEGL